MKVHRAMTADDWVRLFEAKYMASSLSRVAISRQVVEEIVAATLEEVAKRIEAHPVANSQTFAGLMRSMASVD